MQACCLIFGITQQKLARDLMASPMDATIRAAASGAAVDGCLHGNFGTTPSTTPGQSCSSEASCEASCCASGCAYRLHSASKRIYMGPGLKSRLSALHSSSAERRLASPKQGGSSTDGRPVCEWTTTATLRERVMSPAAATHAWVCLLILLSAWC